MATAGQIAECLGVPEVTVNYRASESQDATSYDKSSMGNIEFTKYGCDTTLMQFSN